MRKRKRIGIWAVWAAWGLAIASFSQAGEPGAWLGRDQMPSEGSTRLKVVTQPPTHYFGHPRLSAKKDVGESVPRYEWGYFGGRYHYTGGSHREYYGDYTFWCFKRPFWLLP
jgi:hypothetical protein